MIVSRVFVSALTVKNPLAPNLLKQDKPRNISFDDFLKLTTGYDHETMKLTFIFFIMTFVYLLVKIR